MIRLLKFKPTQQEATKVHNDLDLEAAYCPQTDGVMVELHKDNGIVWQIQMDKTEAFLLAEELMDTLEHIEHIERIKNPPVRKTRTKGKKSVQNFLTPDH